MLNKIFKDIRHQSYNYLLCDGFLRKKPKRRDDLPLIVVDNLETKYKVFGEFHNTLWAGHREVWTTYTKIKEYY